MLRAEYGAVYCVGIPLNISAYLEYSEIILVYGFA
jgi:hypothetical protein